MSLVAYPAAQRQVAGFLLFTIAWLLSAVSMGLAEWRVWYMDEPSLPYSGVACVGMWRVCIYHHDSNSSKAKMCHQYTYRDTFLPPDIHVAQHLMLATNILGIFGKAFAIYALRNLYLAVSPRKAAYSPFAISGALNIAASACASLAVLRNYYAIIHMQGITFPPSLHMPLKPHTQEVGNAMVMVTVSVFLFFMGGLVFLSYLSAERISE